MIWKNLLAFSLIWAAFNFASTYFLHSPEKLEAYLRMDFGALAGCLFCTFFVWAAERRTDRAVD